MVTLSSYILTLAPFLLQSFASPTQFHRRQAVGNSTSISYASTYVVTATANADALITFYPSRIEDESFWTVTTPTTLAKTEIVYPGGWEWMPSPTPDFAPWPTIPLEAPYPLPPAISSSPSSSSFVLPSNLSSASSGQVSLTGSASAGSITTITSPSSAFSSTQTVSSFPSSPIQYNGTLGSSSATYSASPESNSQPVTGSTSAGAVSGSATGSLSLSTQLSVQGNASTQDGSGSMSSPPVTQIGASASGSSIPLSTITGRFSSPASTLPGGCIPSPTGSGASNSASTYTSGSVSASSGVLYCSSEISESIASNSGSTLAGSLNTTLAVSTLSGTETNSASSETKSNSAPSITGSQNSIVSSGTSSVGLLSSGASIPVTWIGSFTATPTQPTEALPVYQKPTTTVAGAAITSNAALLGGLFFALQVNRGWIKDPTFKSQYRDQVLKVKDDTFGLFNSLDVKPPSVPGCSDAMKKRSISKSPPSNRFGKSMITERSLLSTIASIAGDVSKLISCATDVVSNLVDTVEAEVPSLDEIEALTDTLAEIGDDLQEDEDDDPSHTATNDETSKTATQSEQTNSASSTATTGGSSTITSSASTTASSGTSSGYFMCATGCSACNDEPAATGASRVKRYDLSEKRSQRLTERTLPDPAGYRTLNGYILAQIGSTLPSRNAPGQGFEVFHRSSGLLSSAVTQPWLNAAKRVWAAGLYGCTSVIIVSESGVWISHHWESPSFEYADINNNFQKQVLNPIQSGDNGNINMPPAFGLQNNIFSPDTNPQIFITTPYQKGSTSVLAYQSQIDQITSLLTGAGQPYAGIDVNTRGYVKPENDNAAIALDYTARGKVLVQYDNNQVAAGQGDPPAPSQVAIWRVWLESWSTSATWNARPTQVVDACQLGNQKRDPGASSDAGCNGPLSTTAIPSASTGLTTAAIATPSAATSASQSSNPTTLTAPGSITTTARSSSDSSSGPTGTVPTTSGSPSSKPTTFSVPSTITTMPSSSTPSTTGPTTTFSIFCYPFSDPDAGPAPPQCECDGYPGFFPQLSNTASQSKFNPCGYTAPPTKASTSSVPPFITTESNGAVVSCASSTYYNYAVNEIPTCAGASQVISTVASIAQVYASVESVSSASAASIASISSASASVASASAAWSSAAAVPSAGCWILSDDGLGDSSFEIYGINGWAGPNGNGLEKQLFGCGIVSGGEWYEDGESDFQGRTRATQYTYFGLSFFKGGCVERAVHSAGGPAPGTGPGQIACQHASTLSGDQQTAVGGIAGPQLKAVRQAAGVETTATTAQMKEVVVAGNGTGFASGPVSSPDAALAASASKALSALQTAAL